MLQNRRTVEKYLGPAVEEISISPAVVKKISEDPIDERWIEALLHLEKQSDLISRNTKSQASFKAADEVKPVLDRLKDKVATLGIVSYRRL